MEKYDFYMNLSVLSTTTTIRKELCACVQPTQITKQMFDYFNLIDVVAGILGGLCGIFIRFSLISAIVVRQFVK